VCIRAAVFSSFRAPCNVNVSSVFVRRGSWHVSRSLCRGNTCEWVCSGPFLFCSLSPPFTLMHSSVIGGRRASRGGASRRRASRGGASRRSSRGKVSSHAKTRAVGRRRASFSCWTHFTRFSRRRRGARRAQRAWRACRPPFWIRAWAPVAHDN